jgi:plastocyanin
MISLWRISSSTVLAIACLSAASVSGRIELRDSKEKSVRRGGDYSGVVVWLEPLNGKPYTPPQPQRRATMVQKNKRFLPHVLAIRSGTLVDFPNQDPIFHNAFSTYSGQVFDIGLYKPGSSRSVPFTRPGVVRVFCNIHANMSAVIVVVDSPWFATTSADGRFAIEEVPAGAYRLRLFHERATARELSNAERSVHVSDSGTELNPFAISESGYLPTPHLDKHGNPYDSHSDSYKVVR